MIVRKLSENVYKITQDYGAFCERKKTPGNVASALVVYIPFYDEMMIIRGSLMMSKAEIHLAIGGAL